MAALTCRFGQPHLIGDSSHGLPNVVERSHLPPRHYYHEASDVVTCAARHLPVRVGRVHARRRQIPYVTLDAVMRATDRLSSSVWTGAPAAQIWHPWT